jgi:anti-sigma B factor antagonist
MVEADAEQASVALYHQGLDFDPDAVAPPAFDGSRTGGFGLYLIKILVDEVYYFRDPDGRCGVRLVKRRTPAPKGETNMQLTVEKSGDVTVAAVNAEQMDASNADDFKAQMTPVLENCNKLVLDLSKVQFVDSRGCGAILSCLKQVTAAGGDLKLCRVTKPARTVFDLIRLHRICEILDTKEDAVKAFAKPAGAR